MANSPRRKQQPAEAHKPVRPRSSESFLAAVPDMMFRVDRDGRYLEFKPAKNIEPFVPPGEFLGRRMHDVLPEDVADGSLAVIQDALESGEARVYQYELPMDGGVRRYEARIAPLSEDDVLAIVRDVTDAVGSQAAAAVPAQTVAAGTPLDAVPDVMFKMDREGSYLEFKPAKGERPFVPPSQFLGRRMHDILPEDVANAGLAIIESALDSGEAQTFPFELQVDDGVNRYEARVVPLGGDEVLACVRYIAAVKEQPGRRGSDLAYALTRREMAVLEAVATGLTDKQVAQRLEISPLTVRKHVASIRKKMGAQSRTEASVRALKEGLVT